MCPIKLRTYNTYNTYNTYAHAHTHTYIYMYIFEHFLHLFMLSYSGSSIYIKQCFVKGGGKMHTICIQYVYNMYTHLYMHACTHEP